MTAMAPGLRHLPASSPSWQSEADVVVVGSGAAGIMAAITAAGHGRRVLLLTKGEPGGGSTPLAQGGLAAVVRPDDSAELHLRDTLTAGAGLCERRPVSGLVRAAPGVIEALSALGARFQTSAPRLEGGHSRRRIIHAGDDAAGAEVHRVLAGALRASDVEVISGAVALDLLLGEHGAVGGLLVGLVAADGRTLRPGVIRARAVVLATGGFGQAFAVTSNPAEVTGDGLALAARAGAELRDVEFVQFHPTVLWRPGGPGQRPLVTEALRGAGAVLVDSAGRPVMAGRHPLADLAPRDVVAAVMHERIEQSADPDAHLWLDATGVGRATVETGFPSVTTACRAAGIDPAAEPIPVAPGAHYACGGIRAGLDGQTSILGLFAVGEAASTGIHGANRLASNSLTESLLTGQLAGELLGHRLPEPAGDLRGPSAGPGVHPAARDGLATAMSRHAGVVRDADGLGRLLATLADAPDAPAGPGAALDLPTVEAASLHTVSVLVAAAALARRESRGAHRRRDAPATSARPRHTLLSWRDGALTVNGPDAAPAPGGQAAVGGPSAADGPPAAAGGVSAAADGPSAADGPPAGRAAGEHRLAGERRTAVRA